MFTIDNTDGFSALDIETLNTALRIRIERGEDEQAASDAINNAWQIGCDVADLTR